MSSESSINDTTTSQALQAFHSDGTGLPPPRSNPGTNQSIVKAFKDISFRYPARLDQYVLGGPDKAGGFSLRIPPGQTVAFVGPSGSGKSTTVALSLRFYDPEDGRVTLDGHDLKALNVKHLREHVSYVGQEG
ncbi:atp-binding cassette sub-family b member 5-like protein [Nannochloropsis gaditana CCMP526]|uniref:atp-binding cassette sub-family b member 5-like protein n=1 Tax=Nannochloropsis gaditana (strain CCMP526) TaxID=1093141 RepID=UPI00029F54D2|nr:atp-binding cassette sub-family b member 5-like protein [Nannochloropsis gaditana CCMP526]EKU20420.1 atp-binding cassette sub-family b member 5-like protein [Nannochloropsis gaditana CCMP526]|eukprot:XP_005855947.1 atp-binding cassette sub-family b member 5-like protein [Nannochloropsis gaditana CCMP526]